jgi:F-type H+-transporting ATPase subunit a
MLVCVGAAVFMFAKHKKKPGWWLLLAAFVAFVWYSGFHSFKPAVGAGWLAFGLGIYLFEFVVGALQAYIFTLLSAVYIQTSVHPEH